MLRLRKRIQGEVNKLTSLKEVNAAYYNDDRPYYLTQFIRTTIYYRLNQILAIAFILLFVSLIPLMDNEKLFDYAMRVIVSIFVYFTISFFMVRYFVATALKNRRNELFKEAEEVQEAKRELDIKKKASNLYINTNISAPSAK